MCKFYYAYTVESDWVAMEREEIALLFADAIPLISFSTQHTMTTMWFGNFPQLSETPLVIDGGIPYYSNSTTNKDREEEIRKRKRRKLVPRYPH